MKVVLFAGGVGTRLWPLSRKKTPKQFGRIIGDDSMLQIAVSKLIPLFRWEDVYISTGKQYADTVKKQLPKLPKGNLLLEPEMRDVGPAVGLVIAQFIKRNPDEPIALLWGSDHLVKNNKLFQDTVAAAQSIVNKQPDSLIFIGQKPRFANQNLGYIEFGKEVGKINKISVHEFIGFQYRPHLSTAERWVKDGKHAWNLGYFVTTPGFLWKSFKQFTPALYKQLEQISNAYQTKTYEKTLNDIYPKIVKISFDNAVLEHMNPKHVRVISADIGWSDVGAWEGLKEALAESKEANVINGNVLLENSSDNLVYNYEDKKMVVGIDLDDLLIVNSGDVILVCKKTSVPKIKNLVESFKGTKYEKLT